MTTYRELLQRTKAEIREIDAREAQSLEGARWIDVREADEWQEGHLPGAVHVPRGYLESRIEGVAPDKSAPVILYCAAANRSAFAAKTLEELGYEAVYSLAGGFTDWKRNGLEITMPRTLSPEKRTRYSRHLLIPEIGEEGQLKLLDTRILLIGAGGLGSPAALYLAAAGIGRLGIVDADIVDETNLQRQIAHSLDTLGTPKVDSAKSAIERLNPDVEVVTYRERLTSENIDRILDDGWDLIRRRRRQLSDALPRERCVRLAWDSRRPRLDLPLRGPGDGLPAARWALLPLPLPGTAAARACAVLRRRWRARRPSRDRRLAPDERGDQARGGHRRAARRPPPALRRTRHRVHRGEDRAPRRLPRLRHAPDDHGVHRLRGVLRSMSIVRVPPVLRTEAGGAREVDASGSTVRELLDDLTTRLPALGARVYTAGAIQPFVNVYVDGEDVRTRDGLDTPVRDSSTVILLPAMAGGCGR